MHIHITYACAYKFSVILCKPLMLNPTFNMAAKKSKKSGFEF